MGKLISNENKHPQKCHDCGHNLEDGYCFFSDCSFSEECSFLDTIEYRRAYEKHYTHELLIFKHKAIFASIAASANRHTYMIIKVLSKDFERNEVIRRQVQQHFLHGETYIEVSSGSEAEMDKEIESYTCVRPFNRIDYGYCVIYKPR